MRHHTTIRTRAIPGLMALVLALSTAAALASGPGGGGGGGGGGGAGGGGGGGGATAPANTKFLWGTWVGGDPEGGAFRYEFTFTKTSTFTMVVLNGFTGEQTTSTGTYVYGGGVGHNGFVLLTFISQGQVILQVEVSGAAEGIIFDNATLFINIARLG